MKTIIRFASLAAAALLTTACSQEDLVQQPNVRNDGKVAMGFSAKVPNMTRAALETFKTEFGVYAVKTVETEKSLIMDNYWVKYSNTTAGSTWGGGNPETPNLVDHLSYWYYDGIKAVDGALADQVLKYWDSNATKYDFYAYLDYNKNFANVTTSGEIPTDATNRWYNTVDYSLNIRMSASSGDLDTSADAYQNDNYPFMAYTGRTINGNTDDYKDVPFAFRHFNSKVNIQFYTTITAYDVKITDAVVLRTKTATDKVNTACVAVMNGGDPIVTNVSLNNLNQNFSNPTPNPGDKLPSTFSKYGDGTCGTTYYCMPSAPGDDANGDLEVYVKYDLIQGTETIHRDATITLSKDTHTRWLQNKAYLYIFKITAGTLHPIVFDGISVSDYDQVGYSHEFEILETL